MMKRFTDLADITIRHVAQQAGVSVAAASYALNGGGRLTQETREKVLKAASDLGYTPSLAARSLKGQKGTIVGILSDGFAGPWYGEILEGLQPTLKEAGFSVVALTIDKETLTLCRSLVGAGLMRGVVVLNPRAAWFDDLKPVMRAVPTAIFDPDVRYDSAFRYVLDNRGGILSLMGHLWDRGYRDYLWLDGTLDEDWDANERYRAFESFLVEKGFSEAQWRRSTGGFRMEVAYNSVAAILEKGNPPRAIVAANDESAIGALRALREKGFSVPADVAVAGFDGLDVSAWTDPALTTVRFDRRELGRNMAQLILESVKNQAVMSLVQTIPVELVIRASS